MNSASQNCDIYYHFNMLIVGCTIKFQYSILFCIHCFKSHFIKSNLMGALHLGDNRMVFNEVGLSGTPPLGKITQLGTPCSVTILLNRNLYVQYCDNSNLGLVPRRIQTENWTYKGTFPYGHNSDLMRPIVCSNFLFHA